MAFENLSPSAAIWLDRGVSHILMPECKQNQATPAASAPRYRTEARKTMRQSAPLPANKSAPPTWQPLPSAQWPQQWQEQLACSRKGRIVWTYAQLGADLLAGRTKSEQAPAAARALRSKFLRNVFADLKHPQGTHTFWPAQLADDPIPNPEIFWSGLKELGCRGTIIMDPAFASALMDKPSLRPFIQLKFRTQFVWILPDIDNIGTAEYQGLVNFLKCALQAFARG